MSLLGILAFVVALVLSVMIHEWGHYITARRFGMKVTEFFFGFGPKLWSFRRGETEYGAKAIPAGGYVRIVGMSETEAVAPEDEARAFYHQSGKRRVVVLVAGSFMHFVIAAVLLAIVYIGFGSYGPATTVASVSACVPTTATGTGCAKGAPASPAKVAGLQPGDTVTAVDGKPVGSWDELTAVLRDSAGKTLTLTVQRDGKTLQVPVVMATAPRPDLTDPSKTVQAGFLGVAPAFVVTRPGVLQGAHQALNAYGQLVSGSVGAVVHFPARVANLWSTLTGTTPRNPSGFVGVVGIASISGQIAAAAEPIGVRIASFLLIIASVNVFVGIFNLLPLLPLDGGHVAVVVYERVRSRLARARGRPDPGRVDVMKLMPLAYAVLLVFVSLTLLTLAADIFKPLQLQ